MTGRRSILLAIVLLVVVAVGAAIVFGRIQLPPIAPPAARAPTPSPSPAVVGAISVHFTRPIYPDRAENHRGGIDGRLVEAIDGGRTAVDLAIYDFDLENVADALVRARQRGVRVRLVTDSDTATSTNAEIQVPLGRLRDAGIPIVEDDRRPIMHHKFAVVDGQIVLTGSWNFTTGDTYRLNNNLVAIRSPDLAANFTAEFEKMFARRLFGPNKPPGVPHPTVTVDGARIETYFAPQDKVSAKILDRLRRAQSSVRFLTFSFTQDKIGAALIDLHQAGVTVEGIFETTGSETRFSEYGKLKQAGLNVWQDGNPYVMHHKVFIIDDETVIFGSYNFSANADEDNDENLLIVDSPDLARAYTEEFQRILRQAQNPPARRRR